MTAERLGVAWFVAMAVAGAVFGEAFPFSRYPMYAGVPDIEQPVLRAAIPGAWVDGRKVPIEALTHLAGFPDGALARAPLPSSMGWRSDQIRRHLRLHRASTPGPVEVRLGWWVAVADGRGARLAEGEGAFVEDCRGTGRWIDRPPSGS